MQASEHHCLDTSGLGIFVPAYLVSLYMEKRLHFVNIGMEGKASGEYVKIISLLFSICLSIADDDDAAAMAELAAWLPPAPPKWTPNVSTHYCTWGDGITCDDSNMITSLLLGSTSLSARPLPPRFVYLPKLTELDLSDNYLTGSLPNLADLTSLGLLDLSKNRFTNMTSEFFSGLSNTLRHLNLDDNPFLHPWRIPAEFARFTNLEDFFAREAKIVGHIPDIFNSCSVQRLGLSFNNLSGSLPSSFGVSKITVLRLSGAGLTGRVDVIASMFGLTYAYLAGNRFTGSIPNIPRYSSLTEIYLDDNQLTGVVPESLASIDGLEVVSFSGNKLQGPYPARLNKTVHPHLHLGGNNFCAPTGEACHPQVMTLLDIASTLDYPLKLSTLWVGNDACNNWSFVSCNFNGEITAISFQNQQFTGTISPAFANLTSLEFLYLNGNNLTGVIPESLTKLSHLSVLDVSNNNLSGAIPKFASSVKVVTAGNILVLHNNNKSVDFPNNSGSSGKGEVRELTIIGVSLFWLAIGVICLVWLWLKVAKNAGQKAKHTPLYTDEVCPGSIISKLFDKGKNQAVQLFSFEQLVTATSNFSSDNELGHGGFGSVFKGILQGQEIAVKRLSRASAQGPKEFVNEVVVISKLQHRNLVRLLGFYVDKEEKMLVYEYMPNKSLDASLFDSKKRRLMGWRERFNIILGISKGLLYLHKDSRLLVIHRDLKASNILLDKDWNPKISDFGLAKMFDCSMDQADTKRIVGTYGYMPPEYAMEGRFSEKSDVFSFGVLILEIISGRKSSSFGSSDESLLEYAWKLWNDGAILGFVDPVISDSISFEELRKCIHVGLLCTQFLVTDRPSTQTVTSMLTGEIDNFPPPRKPAFLQMKASAGHSSINDVTITSIVGR